MRRIEAGQSVVISPCSICCTILALCFPVVIQIIFLAAQMDASLDNPLPADISSMGILAKIVRTVKMDDNNLKVIVEGKRRARALEYLSTYPYYQVLVKEITEIESSRTEINEILKNVLTLFEEYLKLSQHTNLEAIIPALRDNNPQRIADIILLKTINGEI